MWRRLSRSKILAGHGGMDYLMLRDMVESFKNGTPPSIDVYDAAAWMSVTALSKKSIEEGCVWVDFPEFKRNK